MRKKSGFGRGFGVGVAVVMLFLVVVGASFAAIAGSGSTITVPGGKTAIYFFLDNADAVHLRDAMCHNYGYQDKVLDENLSLVDNPVSCAEFSQKPFIRLAKENMLSYDKYLYEQSFVEVDYVVSE